MRQIQTKDKKDKKDTRNKIIIGVVLTVLLVFSTVGFAFFSGSDEGTDKKEYNGIEFILGQNGLWYFQLNDATFRTQYFPKETDNISIQVFVTINNYVGKPLYFVGGGQGVQEIGGNLLDFLSRRPQSGCIEDFEDLCSDDAPLKDCAEDNIIIFQETNDTSITQEDNCVFISSPYGEQGKAADAFLFKILGI